MKKQPIHPFFIVVCLLLASRAHGQVSTVAGGGVGDGDYAINATLNSPRGIAFDPHGNLYISEYDGYRVRKVDMTTGLISTVAGGSAQGYSEDGGLALESLLLNPSSIAIDSSGNIYISDSGSDIVLDRYYLSNIRKIDSSTKLLSTAVGSGGQGGTDDGEVATKTRVAIPQGLTFDTDGNLYFANSENNRVNKVDALTKIITTIAGSYYPRGGNGDGGLATDAQITRPSAIALDKNGNLYIATTTQYNGGPIPQPSVFGNRIRKVDPVTKIITTIAGTGFDTYSGDEGPATLAAINTPQGLAVDTDGNLYISTGNRVRKIDIATMTISTIAGTGEKDYGGDGGNATQAKLNQPSALSFDAYGNLYIADTGNNRIRKINATTQLISTIAGPGPCCFRGDGGLATSAMLKSPEGIEVAKNNDLYISDTGNNRIRWVDANTKIINTIAGTGTAGYSGDVGLAKDANLNSPTDLAFDSDGSLYFADTENHRIRKIDATTQIISTVAGTGTMGYSGDGGLATSANLNYPRGIAFDSLDNLFIADNKNHRVRKVSKTSGIITTVAGKGSFCHCAPFDDIPATDSEIAYPSGVDLDKDGNLFIVDRGNSRIRKVDAESNVIHSVKGLGWWSPELPAGTKYVYDPGTPTESDYLLHTVSVDKKTNIIITSRGQLLEHFALPDVFGIIAGRSKPPYYQPIGGRGFYGDGYPPTEAVFYNLNDLAFDTQENYYVVDKDNNRIRSWKKAKATPLATLPGAGTYGDTVKLNTGGTTGIINYTIINDFLTPGGSATVNGTNILLTHYGFIKVLTSVSGDEIFTPISFETVIFIQPSNQVITFNPLPEKNQDDEPFAISATSSSSLPISFTSSNTSVASVSGNVVTISGVGETDITATQSGNDNYNPAQASQKLTVNPLHSATIYPNPSTKGIFFIIIPDKNCNSVFFEVLNSGGAEMLTGIAAKSQGVASIDLGSLSSGEYIIHLETCLKSITVKAIKM